MGFISPQDANVANLYIGSLGVLDFGSANVVFTHSAETITVTGMTTFKFPATLALDWGAGDITVTGGTNTLTLAGGQFITPYGSVSLPGLAIGAADTGIYGSATALQFTLAGTQVFQFDNNNNLILTSTTGSIIMGNGDGPVLRRDGDNNILQLGSDAAAAAAQTLKGSDARAGTDTNTAGGNITIAPGRSTGTAAGGVLYLATSPKGATGTAANALVNRVQVDFEGVAGFSPQDAAATPIEPTAALKCFAHNKSVADDGVVTLPAITTNAWGTCVAGDASVRTQFVVDASGTVTLVNNTASVVANADTDTNLCIGTAATQEPLQVKNRLGGIRVLNLVVWYD